jgi:ABC-type transporter Mla subunit MlaD
MRRSAPCLGLSESPFKMIHVPRVLRHSTTDADAVREQGSHLRELVEMSRRLRKRCAEVSQQANAALARAQDVLNRSDASRLRHLPRVADGFSTGRSRFSQSVNEPS